MAILENSLEIEARIHGEKSPEAFHLRRMLCRVLATEGHLDEARKRAEGLLQSMAQVPGMSALDIAEGKVLLAELLLEGEEAGGDSGVAAEPPAQTSQAVEQLPAGRPGQLAATERVPPPNLSAAALLLMDACQIQRQMLGRSFPEIDDALLRLIPALEKRGEKDLAKRCRQVVDVKAAPETP